MCADDMPKLIAVFLINLSRLSILVMLVGKNSEIRSALFPVGSEYKQILADFRSGAAMQLSCNT